jgi:hypothetical protein
VTLGYGYQPWRALFGLLAVVLTTVALAVILGGHGGLVQGQAPPAAPPQGCTIVDRIGAGLDMGTPFFTSRTHCEAADSATGKVFAITGWALRLLAWAFATLFIAGFTGAVRKA